MYYLPEQKLVFLSNPKCASTSIRSNLYNRASIRSNEVGDILHMNFRQAIDYLTGRGIGTNGLTFFTTIRNPWQRMVSLYRHIVANKVNNNAWAEVTKRNLAFEEFINDPFLQKHIGRLAVDKFCYADRYVDHMFDIGDPSLLLFLDGRGIESNLPRKRDLGGSEDYADMYNLNTQQIVREIFAADIEFGGYEFTPEAVLHKEI